MFTNIEKKEMQWLLFGLFINTVQNKDENI